MGNTFESGVSARRGSVAVVVAVLLLIASIGGAGVGDRAHAQSTTAPAKVVPAANLEQFDPGYIISDGVFFNSQTMGEAQIQAFLESKVPRCQSGYVCLRDWRDTSRTTSGDAMCGPYAGAANERASTIVYKVALACGINPQVLLVTLQKEQGLITHTWPSDWRYTIAMGQGCPDTAACDTRYYGFFNQVYGAAWQLKRYANPPGTSRYFTWYSPGRTWNVQYHPNQACGSSPVLIQNQATANLYYYTPYQPNRAALSSDYGTGDGCSAYGNRNFFSYFSDWFGSTRHAVVGGLLDYWGARGGAAGYLGEPTSGMTVWSGEGWSQPFQNADLLQKLGRQVVAVGGAFRDEYRVVGHFWSGLGWPSTEQARVAGGWYQDFDGGRIYVRPDGRGIAVAAPMFATHEALANLSGWLGWPAGRAYRLADGSAQDFDGGSIFAGPSAVVALGGDMAAFYRQQGGPTGALGWPLSASDTTATSAQVTFQNGVVTRTAAGIAVIYGGLASYWQASGGPGGSVGQPTGGMSTWAQGWTQPFERGDVFQKVGGGVHAVTGAYRGEYRTVGHFFSGLGWPTTDAYPVRGGGYQNFEGGRLYLRPDGVAYAIAAPMYAVHEQKANVTGWLGWPVNRATRLGDGSVQGFDGGSVYSGPAGTVAVRADVAAFYVAQGGPGGRLGWPLQSDDSSAVGARTVFQGGTVERTAGGMAIIPR